MARKIGAHYSGIGALAGPHTHTGKQRHKTKSRNEGKNMPSMRMATSCEQQSALQWATFAACEAALGSTPPAAATAHMSGNAGRTNARMTKPYLCWAR